MMELLSPIRSESLVDVFVSRFEELIVSGQISIGQRLPSERELAVKLGVSRPVVHEGLLELQARGLVTLKPRKGAFVNDFRSEGSLAVMESLLAYHDGLLEPKLLDGLIHMRRLFELETVRLAARNRTGEQILRLEDIVEAEERCTAAETDRITELDFSFHHLIAISSGNLVYPLLINSFKPVYTNLTGKFFSNPAVLPEVVGFHGEIVAAVEARDEARAVKVMEGLLDHGVVFLKRVIGPMGPRRAQGKKNRFRFIKGGPQ
jgi:DNA-binding FadR family transcriptional regulator